MAIPRNILISRVDRGQGPGASISGGGFEAFLPGANMLDMRPQLVAQASGASVNFSLVLGGSYPISVIHLQGIVSLPSAQVSVTAGAFSFTGNLWATDTGGAYDPLEFASIGRQRIFVPPAPVSVASIDISISGGGTPLQIGYVGACECWEPQLNYAPGLRMSYLDLSSKDLVKHGSMYISRAPKYRRLSVGLGAILDESPYMGGTDAEIAECRRVMAMNGLSSPIIVVPQPDHINSRERDSVWGTLSDAPDVTNPVFPFYEAAFQVDQLV